MSTEQLVGRLLASTNHKPSDHVIAWPETTLRRRMEACRVQLVIEGMLSGEEAALVARRIELWAKAAAPTSPAGEP